MSTGNDTRFWDKTARKYATDPIKDLAGYERTVERTRQLLDPGSRVLEIGCGTGTTALRLAPFLARFEANDVSAEMIAIAREKALAFDCQNVKFEVATADRASETGGPFDAVLAFNVLHLLADRRATFASIRASLKPGGLFISKTPCLSEMSLLIRYAVPVARTMGKAPFVDFFNALELEAEVSGAGFAIVARERHGSERKDARIFIVAQKPEA